MMEGSGKLENSRIMRNINLLTSNEKIKRKNALLEISQELFEDSRCLVSEDELNSIFIEISLSLLRILSDESDICRELGISLLKTFLFHLPVHEKYLCKVMPYLSQRIGGQKIMEPSEEIRLSMIELLTLIVNKYGALLNPYLNEIVQILSNTVLDPFPVVKRESCDCISMLANSLPKQFHLQSQTLVKPTLNALSHQHYKVRLAAVNAINDVIRFGNSKSVDDVIGPLAGRLFDQNSTVRLAVARTVGNWLMNFPDRYSYFHKFLPLILTCLMDEIPDNRKKALDYWETAGIKYESENEEELKDVKNYIFSPPSHYPQIVRPGLGCRILVKNNFSKILPALLKELEDWTSEVRFKSASLLYQLILHLENNVTLNLEKVLTGLYFAAGDDEESIVKQAEKSAELIGYFVPPDVYCGLILPVIQTSPTSGHLFIFASILMGSTKSSLATELVSIADVLCKHEICYNMKSDFQKELLKCCRTLILVCGDDCCSISSQLFNIILALRGLSSDTCVIQSCDEVLVSLRDLENFSSDEELFNKYMGPLLEKILVTADGWFAHSPEKLIFETLLKKAGAAITFHWDSISQIFKTAFKPEGDPEVKLKLLTLLSDILTSNENPLKSLPNPTSSLFLIIREVVFPNLEWRAGRTASALRTAAVSCLLSCFSYMKTLSLEFISSDPTYLTVLLSLVEDDSPMTRELTLHCLCKIFEESSDKLSAEVINKASEVIVRRLDDVNDNVRMTCLKVLTLLFSKLPENYEVSWHRSHILSIYSIVLTHLDDSDEQFTKLVLESLKNLGQLLPSELYEKVTHTKNNFRNVRQCEDLLEYLKMLNINHV